MPTKDGWVDATQYRPYDYDLCRLKLPDDKYVSGWWTGNVWDGLRFDEMDSDKVIAWKRIKEE